MRLLNIELYKLRNSRYFWWLGGLFIFFLLSVPLAARLILVKMTEMGAEIKGRGMDDLPLFDFLDIWQNLTYFYSIFSILLAFIIIISVSNEYRYGTVRQNIIDGLSRKQFLASKVLFILGSSAFVTLLILVIGLGMGFAFSEVTSVYFVTKNMHFLVAYFFELVGYQLLALFASLLIKRSGLTIVIMLFYTFIIEPLLRALISFKFELPWLADLLPVKAVGNSIKFPYSKYALMETQTYVGLCDFLVVLLYVGIFSFLSYRIITKKDLA